LHLYSQRRDGAGNSQEIPKLSFVSLIVMRGLLTIKT
jgi:hypothetical protein